MLMRAAQQAGEVVLDLRGMNCPQPVLRAKKALRALPVGAILVLECTDPLTVIDVPHFVKQTGHELAEYEQQGALFVFRIVKQK
jgi:tRNA 2-thiouridine synthesizing protein A